MAGWIVDVDPFLLLSSDARGQMWLLVTEGYPPDIGHDFLLGRTIRGLLWAVIETLAISIVGTTLAVAFAIPLALASASIPIRGRCIPVRPPRESRSDTRSIAVPDFC
ncbi:ABC transporter permease family protein [Natrinema saccharevitans]|uniref:hypothetical protein n=1 Tax=Natrinema saccharevitans TaxID=301967 RepID=UPI001C37709B|nr:hypothetical protein [Natrinema saccharevitans]